MSALSKARHTGGVITAFIAIMAPLAGAAAGAPVAGSAGTDTSLPATASQLTVSGRGRFASLKVTVNQTKNLVNQAVSVTWAGGMRTSDGGGGLFARDYLQIMQCWGEDDGTHKENPGPPPEQCVQGATRASYGVETPLFSGQTNATERVVTQKNWPNFDPALGTLDERSGLVWKPFRAVDGTVVGVHKDSSFNPAAGGGRFWLNQYFNVVTTNEVAAGRTGANGRGAELFEVTTGVESSGLGCGQKVEPVAGGAPRVPKCWLVIVPRGLPVDENVGTPAASQLLADQAGVLTSPLAPLAWANRIAVPLEFNPVDSPCRLSDDERRIVGSALAASVVSSWQPTLCATAGRLPYSYATVNESAARQQLAGGTAGAAGMIVVSRPFGPTAVRPDRPVTYAPISASATVIGFNVEREAKGGDDEVPLTGVRVADIKLTPRLLAKLLTQSYFDQVAIANKAPADDWVKKNPTHLGFDPEFLTFNPEFNLLSIRNAKNFGGLVLPAGNSDTAHQVWDYVLADPEAKAWLDGTPDAWGMKVNPVYATTAGANRAGVPFADPLPDSFPKSDPTCYQGPPLGSRGEITPPPLCGTDWLPYAPSLHDAARRTRAADDGARVIRNPFAQKPDEVYKSDGPQQFGRAVIALTDSASASQYGLQTAMLSRAGDDKPDRSFIAPDGAGISAGIEAMMSKSEPAVLEPDPKAAKPAGYPLAALTYAAVAPLSLDKAARSDYAAFLDYAAGPGQVPGLELGQLPRGYAPLPAALRAQATAAAKTIRELKPAAPPAAAPVPARSTPAQSTPTTAVRTTSPAGQSPGTGGDRSASSPPGSASGGGESAPTEQALRPIVAATDVPNRSPGPASPLATPFLVLARSRFVLPVLVAVAILAAWGSLEITKRPRWRGLSASADGRSSRKAATS